MPNSTPINTDAILAWRNFPASIQSDPCFSAFREEFDSAHGNVGILFINFIRNRIINSLSKRNNNQITRFLEYS